MLSEQPGRSCRDATVPQTPFLPERELPPTQPRVRGASRARGAEPGRPRLCPRRPGPWQSAHASAGHRASA